MPGQKPGRARGPLEKLQEVCQRRCRWHDQGCAKQGPDLTREGTLRSPVLPVTSRQFLSLVALCAVEQGSASVGGKWLEGRLRE